MSRHVRLAIVSDPHYAGAAERARGQDYELRGLPNPFVRFLLRLHRRYVWLRDPLSHGGLVDRFLERVGPVDWLVANGDYSCDSAFIGVVDDAACASARECLGRLRARFPGNFRALIGDHELGKLSFVGGNGGMRLASWERTRGELALEPFWRLELGRYVLMGVTSTLVALPSYAADALPAELPVWEQLRAAHLAEIRAAFTALRPDQRVLLFCHDPTGMSYLWREDAVRAKLGQVEQTIFGHLHSNLVYYQSRLLAGMPRINFLGHSARKMSAALNAARCWRHFRPRLCPAMAGVELLKDGGFYTVDLDQDAATPARFTFHGLPRCPRQK